MAAVTAARSPDVLNPAWQENYRRGRYNRYPYDGIVSFVLRRFGAVDDRSRVRILDLGCGGGNNLRFLHEEGFDFRAIDGAPESARLARSLLGLAADDSRIATGDFVRLPYDDVEFDAVIDRASLGCNRAVDLPSIVGEIHRVLKPGAPYFAADLYDQAHPDLAHGVDVGAGDYQQFNAGVFVAARQIHAFTIAELRGLFARFATLDIKQVRIDNVSNDTAAPVHVGFDVIASKATA